MHLPDPPGTPLDRRQPRIVTCHDLIPLVLARQYLAPVPGARTLQWLRDIARYRSARRVIAISEATRRDLIQHVGVAPERIDVVHSGVDHARFSATLVAGERERMIERLGFDAPFLLCLGASDVRQEPAAVGACLRSERGGQGREAGVRGADLEQATRASRGRLRRRPTSCPES